MNSVFHANTNIQVTVTPEEFERFVSIRETLEKLCICYAIPVPVISMFEHGDPCDSTDTDCIRLNPPAADPDITIKEYACHVFGHYLCNLEQSEYSDQIADLVGNWAADGLAKMK